MPKTMRINAKHYFVMKIPNNREPQQIASNNSSDFEIKHFIKPCKDYTNKPFPFLDNQL